jgi:capsular polysaccharide biosynthesis protein
MDVQEVVRRVGLAYWPLILGLVVVGVAGAVVLHHNDAPIYTSDVRFVIDVPDPKAAAESASIADTAKSIATSRSNVAEALAAAGVSRDVEQFATRNIELLPLGTSGVMDLQVKDTNAAVAATVANALAVDVIYTRSTVDEGQADQLAASLTSQLKAVDASLANLDARIAGYRSSSSDPSVSAAALSGLYSERTSLAQEHLTLETEINQINQSLALRPHSGIIDPPEPASQPDPSRAPIDMALGGLGGLVLGIIIASVMATLRPRFSGRREISRMLDAPVLGDLDTLDDEAEPTLPTRIRIAAIRAGVKRVQLVPLDGSDEAASVVSLLAERFGFRPVVANAPVPLNSNGQAVTARRRTQSQAHGHLDVAPFDPSVLSLNGNASEVGLILVAPSVLDGKALAASADLLSMTGSPVAGVVTYGPGSGRHSGGRYVVRRNAALRSRQFTDHDVRLNPFGRLQD